MRNELEHCGKPDEAPACKVETRYIYEVFRNTPKELVFAQTLFGLELASVDPRIVGINFVGAEDDVISMADHSSAMQSLIESHSADCIAKI